MKLLTRLDKISLLLAASVFAVTTTLGWYVRFTVEGEAARAAALKIFVLGAIVVVATGIVRDLIRRKKLDSK